MCFRKQFWELCLYNNVRVNPVLASDMKWVLIRIVTVSSAVQMIAGAREIIIMRALGTRCISFLSFSPWRLTINQRLTVGN